MLVSRIFYVKDALGCEKLIGTCIPSTLRGNIIKENILKGVRFTLIDSVVSQNDELLKIFHMLSSCSNSPGELDNIVNYFKEVNLQSSKIVIIIK